MCSYFCRNKLTKMLSADRLCRTGPSLQTGQNLGCNTFATLYPVLLFTFYGKSPMKLFFWFKEALKKQPQNPGS